MSLALKILFKRLILWVPFLMISTVILVTLGDSDRIPTADAPHMLAIADKLANKLAEGAFLDFFESFSSLVTPHPPAGYLLPIVLSLLGVEKGIPTLTGLAGLAMAWHGMLLLTHRETLGAVTPWLGGLILFSSALVWGGVEHMVWDLAAAGCVAACVGHLHASDGLRNKGHALLFGLFMGLGFVTKFTFAGFLILPVAFAGLAVMRFRSFSGLGVSLAGFAIVAAPWLWNYGDAVWAYVAHSSGTAHSISDSPASPWSHRFRVNNLLYYPTVLRDILGWPGLAMVVVAVGRAAMVPAGRWAVWSVLGGGVVLTFAGENQARYLLPALPLLGVIFEVGIRPGLSSARSRFGLICGLGATLPALWGTWMTFSSTEFAPPSRDHHHPVESLTTWGTWPWPAAQFWPTSNPMKTWRVDGAIAAIAEQTGPGAHQIGLLAPQDVRMPPVSSYAWRAGQRGLEWDVASIVVDGPGGRPMVFVGPLKPLGYRISRRFKVVYAIHPLGKPPAILKALGAKFSWTQALPSRMQGTVFSVPDTAWDTPTGLLLNQDPIDG
jgi:hypothetical protein